MAFVSRSGQPTCFEYASGASKQKPGQHLDQLIHSGLGPKEAAKKVLKAIPSNSSLLEGTKGNEKTVARWRYKKR